MDVLFRDMSRKDKHHQHDDDDDDDDTLAFFILPSLPPFLLLWEMV